MRLNASWIVGLACVAGEAGCTGDREERIADPAGRSLLFDSARYAEVSFRLRDAFACHDSAYCDSVLPLFDDTALAREHPDRVVDGFVSDLIGHDAPQTATSARFNELVAYSAAPIMRNWRDYLVARALQDEGAREQAIAAFEPLLERFVKANDTIGVASVCKRIGNLYLELGEPGIAAKYLLRARALEPRVDLRAVITATLGRCYVLTGPVDSIRWCMERLNEDASDRLNEARGDERAAINARWLAHLAALLQEDRSGKAGALHEAAAVDARIRSVDDGYLVAGDEAARSETAIIRVRALMALGRMREAEQALSAMEGPIGQCAGCLPQRLSFLSASSDVKAALGDHRTALRYQQERADVLVMNNVGRERLAVEQARAKADQEMQEAEAQRAFEAERVIARTREKEHRAQRTHLVMLIGLVTLIGGLLVNRARLKRRIQLDRLRTRLSRDLHDDIGSTLSSINILSTVARRKAEAGDEEGAAASLTGISERSQRLMRNMSDLVWSVDPNKDSTDDLLARMREFGVAVLEPKGIGFRFDTSAGLPATWAPEVKSNLYLIFKEAVNNAAKHAHATQVTASFVRDGAMLRMTIADNGKGPEHAGSASDRSGGNGLRNMHARAREMNGELHLSGSPGAGTTIELVLPL
ncbi:MAG: histidine kinase [Flavobacteriales bacterium]